MSRQQSAAVGPVILSAACLGALIGVFVRPVWTDNLIGAQILAGVVHYPADSLMPLVYLRPHSVLTQLAALLLMGGMDEWSVALCFSALQGAVACAALGALTLVFVRHRLASFAALLVPALCVPLVFLRFAESLPMWPGHYLRVFHGHLYPNTFPVGPGVFGVVGLFVGVLAIALIGLDRRRSAAVALGLLPAIHVGMALPIWLGVGVVAAVSWRRRAGGAREMSHTNGRGVAAWFGLGLLLSAISVGVYATYVPSGLPGEMDAATVAQLLQGWDDHTRLLRPWEWVGLFESEIYTAILATALLMWRPPEVTSGARTVIWIVLAITVVGVVYTAVAQTMPATVPTVVRTALVTRWLNVSSWFFPVAALAMLWRMAFVEGRRAAAVVLAVLVVLVWGRMASGITIASALQTMAVTTPSWPWFSTLRYLGLVFPWLLVGGAVLMWRQTVRTDVRATPRAWHVVAVGVVALGWILPFRNAAWFGAQGNGTCRAVVARAQRTAGPLLLGADLWEAEWLQVRTRRPIVFEAMDLNILPFTPAASTQVVRILERVYGRSLDEGLSGRLDRDWPTYDEDTWRRIAREFPATQVIVTSDLMLQLPLVERDAGCALYQLPEGS